MALTAILYTIASIAMTVVRSVYSMLQLIQTMVMLVTGIMRLFRHT